jgi:hypothetical protein
MIIFAYLQTSMLWVVNKQRKQWQKKQIKTIIIENCKSNAPPAATGGREQIATERTI